MSDDLYVNAGDDFGADTAYYPEAPTERREAEATEAAIKAASYPILGDVADWFEEQIKNCDTLQNIQFDIQTINGIQVDRKMSVEVQVLAYAMLAQLLTDKYQEFKAYKHER